MPHGAGARARRRAREIERLVALHQLRRGPGVLVYQAPDMALMGEVDAETAARAALARLGRIADGALILRPGQEGRVQVRPVTEGAALAHIGRSVVREYTPRATWATGAAARTARAAAYETETDRRALRGLRQGDGRQVVVGMVQRIVKEAGREAVRAPAGRAN